MTILYEDNHLVGLVKSAGVPSQPDPSGDPSVLDQLKEHIRVRYGKPGEVFIGLIHRLDRPVGGVMVFARTSKAARRLFEQFRLRQVEKRYLAMVHGRPAQDQGELVHHLRRDRKQNRSFPCAPTDRRGKEARLRYRLRASHENLSLLEVELGTGRHHQIRAQLLAAGLPILGDVKYGGKRPLKSGNIALFAHYLRFRHPVRDQPVELSAQPEPEYPWTIFLNGEPPERL